MIDFTNFLNFESLTNRGLSGFGLIDAMFTLRFIRIPNDVETKHKEKDLKNVFTQSISTFQPLQIGINVVDAKC